MYQLNRARKNFFQVIFSVYGGGGRKPFVCVCVGGGKRHLCVCVGGSFRDPATALDCETCVSVSDTVDVANMAHSDSGACFFTAELACGREELAICREELVNGRAELARSREELAMRGRQSTHHVPRNPPCCGTWGANVTHILNDFLDFAKRHQLAHFWTQFSLRAFVFFLRRLTVLFFWFYSLYKRAPQ